jgi:hypothetical protein
LPTLKLITQLIRMIYRVVSLCSDNTDHFLPLTTIIITKILMTSKPNKNMDSIGHGLLNDKQKYRKEETDAIEMKDRSKKYNYVNLDDQGIH